MSGTQQPWALRLADDLDGDWTTITHMRDAAAELRHQHARIAELEDVADMAIKRIAELEAQLSAAQSAAQEMDTQLAAFIEKEPNHDNQ